MNFRLRSPGERAMLSGDCIPVIIEANDDYADPPNEARLKGQIMGIFERNLLEDAPTAGCWYDFTI